MYGRSRLETRRTAVQRISNQSEKRPLARNVKRSITTCVPRCFVACRGKNHNPRSGRQRQPLTLEEKFGLLVLSSPFPPPDGGRYPPEDLFGLLVIIALPLLLLLITNDSALSADLRVVRRRRTRQSDHVLPSPRGAVHRHHPHPILPEGDQREPVRDLGDTVGERPSIFRQSPFSRAGTTRAL